MKFYLFAKGSIKTIDFFKGTDSQKNGLFLFRRGLTAFYESANVSVNEVTNKQYQIIITSENG
ncbi:hypothetical protein Q757_07490 [Oenococcus alcoholitolerans]|uniref:Uncharacterized protein n=1 Tax=Oenococcus alcoholitolerans TaxID=931074 RepID=A0ABR4XPM4_9LACO|nr:hypothetical protein Q757_07490 [Oenococcus alcoholitolerans]